MQPDMFAVLEATWPPMQKTADGIWCRRDGAGGGKRVSATTAKASPSALETRRYVRAHPGETLFQLTPEQSEADAALAAEGFEIVDPTEIYYAPMDALTLGPLPPITAFPIWPPLQIMRDLWMDDGIGPARLAVMERAATPKTALLGRIDDRAAGAAFVSTYQHTAMLHGLTVRPPFRRKGLGRHLTSAAIGWAKAQGANGFSLAVIEANEIARALYLSLGMSLCARYHYRRKAD